MCAGFGYGVIQPVIYDKAATIAPPRSATLALSFVMAMNYLAVMVCPFIVDLFRHLFGTPVVLGLRLVGDGGDRFDRHAQQCGDLLRAFAHGLQLVDLHRISLLLWLAELYRLGGLLRLLLRRRVPWVDRRLLIPLIRGLRGLLGSVLLLRVVLLGLLHGRLLGALLDRLPGLASVDETVDAGRGFDVEFEHLRRLGRVAPRAETHEPFRDGVARLRDLHARLTAGLAKRLQLDSPTFDPE